MTVRSDAKPVLELLLKLLHEIAQLRQQEAIRALAAEYLARLCRFAEARRATL